MAFQKDKTGIRQTATNAAATLTAALVNAGIISDTTTARIELGAIRDELFADLEPILVADNAMLKAEAEANPPRARSSAPRSTGGGAPKRAVTSTPGNAYKGTAEEALAETVTFGKFKTDPPSVTYGELLNMPASQAAEFGHVDKQGNGRTGRSYLEWLQTNENNAWAAEVAQLVLGTAKVGV